MNGRIVEFGLVLPDGRRLPDRLEVDRRPGAAGARDGDATPWSGERLTKAVESEVVRRSKEVAGYLDPSVTAPLAVAAVPDAAYALLRRAHADAYRNGVVVISYSQALPFVLFLYGVMARLGGAVDAQACLADVAAVLDLMESTLENKLARAATMLTNGSEELRGQMGKPGRRSHGPEPSPRSTIPRSEHSSACRSRSRCRAWSSTTVPPRCCPIRRGEAHIFLAPVRRFAAVELCAGRRPHRRTALVVCR